MRILDQPLLNNKQVEAILIIQFNEKEQIVKLARAYVIHSTSSQDSSSALTDLTLLAKKEARKRRRSGIKKCKKF